MRETRRWTRRGFLGTGGVVCAGVAFGPGAVGRLLAEPAPAAGASADVSGASLAAMKPFLQELVREMERHVPYAAVFAENRRMTSIDVDDRSRNVGDGFPSRGIVFTVYNGAWFEESATTDLSPDALRRTARALASSARLRRGGPEIDPGSGGEAHFVTPCEIDPRTRPLRERFEWTTELHARARRIDPGLVNCSASYLESVTEEVFVNRAKAWSQELLRLRANVALFAPGERGPGVNWDTRAGSGGLELVHFSDEDLTAIAADARRIADAVPLDPGEYRVVVDGSVAGTLAHESFGHGVELDMFVKGRALAEQYLGERVGSDLVDILDDPSLDGSYARYFFDHEGVPARPTRIVESGIFVQGLSDLMSWSRLGGSRTANGRRQDFGRKTYARMSTTFFAPGSSTRAALIEGVEHGYLLEKFTHGMEDPKGWGILVGAHIGREIRNGKLTGRIANRIGLTGYVPDVLASVDGVSNDFTVVPGTCGKGHKEFVPVASGGPHLRLTARLS
jgi:TldD protein